MSESKQVSCPKCNGAGVITLGNKASKAVDLYYDGKTLREIGAELEMSHEGVRLLLIRANVFQSRKIRTATKRERVVELFYEGLKIPEIAERSGYSESYVYRMLSRMGKLRYRTHANKKYSQSEIEKLWLEGLNLQQIADAVGCHYNTVQRALKGVEKNMGRPQ